MKIKFFLLLFLFGSVICMFAQQTPQLPQQVKVKLPEILSAKKLPVMDELQREFCPGSNWGQNKRAKAQAWVVYSDRDDNVTYTSPNKASRLKDPLHFAEKVCIAKISGDMALVYTDEKAHTNYPNIPSNAKCKGWVPMENLLLWNRCPTDQRGVQKKGIIAINLNKMSKDERFQERRYNSPDNLGKHQMLNTDMNFYYVMKETPDGEFTLLCTSAKISNAQTFYGWVNKNAYTEWNQRSCLEPNWLPKFVETHRNNYRAYIYESETGSAHVTFWQYGTSNGDTSPLYKYRMNPNQLRFPILSQPDANGRVLCTSFADRTYKSINKAASYVDRISDQVNKTGKEMLQMNVILAVEATTEMAKFMPAIKKALATCSDYAQQGLNVRVGLVLYGAQGEGVTSVPLSKYDDARLLGMLGGNKAQTRLTGERNVALAQAIEKAVNPTSMGFNPSQSNMLLVIGYHGINETVWHEQSLLNKLVANNIQLASIQVMRAEAGSCKRYFDAMESLIKQNVETQYREISARAIFQNARDKNKNLSNDGYLFTSSLSASKGGNPLFASVRYNSMQNQEMSTDALTRYVSNSISGFSRSVNASKSIYEEALSDVDFYPDFLKKKLGERGYAAWQQVRAISAYGGYAQVGGLNDDDDWRAVLYLSDDELTDLIVKLKDVSDAAVEQNPDRTKFVNAIRTLLRAQLGGSIPDDEINELSPEELENAIYGIVNVKSENLRFTKYPLKDLINGKKVPNDEYQNVLYRFDTKYKKFSKIRSGYKYRMEVGGMYYYWIPLEDLP